MMFSGYSELGSSGSKFEKIMVARKSGLFSKWHTSGLKISDPSLKIGSSGTYEMNLGEGKTKINFKGLSDGNVDMKIETKGDTYSVSFTKKINDSTTTEYEYEVESKGGVLNHSLKADGSFQGLNGFVKVGGDVADPTITGSFFFDVPMVSGLRAVMDAKSKMSGGCTNISGLHYSGIKDFTASATLKMENTSNPEIAVDCVKKMDKFEGGLQIVHSLKSSNTNFVGAVGYYLSKDHSVHCKFNKDGQIACLFKKAFGSSFNLEFGALTSAKEFANPKGLANSVKVGLKCNLKF